MIGHQAVLSCRYCSCSLVELYNFGDIALTGVFRQDGTTVPRTPLSYGMCLECGLNQLMHEYSLESLYGDSYGYESHLNSEMKSHLKSKAETLQALYLRNSNSSILDIASNDGTFLSYFNPKIRKFGIDPLIGTVANHYPHDAIKIKSFFNADSVLAVTNGKLFDVVTSLSVYYDVSRPLEFAKDVHKVLKSGGVWHLEQSYLPSMVNTLSFDTICHEHLLYFGVIQIRKILVQAGFSITSVSLNNINGGSIAVTAVKTSLNSSKFQDPFLEYLEKREIESGYLDGSRMSRFFSDIEIFRSHFRELIGNYSNSGKYLFGIGASTKGNMLIQFCGLGRHEIAKIAEVNPRKFFLETPGSGIPIVNQSEVLEAAAKFENSVAVVFPWHFRTSILNGWSAFLGAGGSILFPLPKIEVERM